MMNRITELGALSMVAVALAVVSILALRGHEAATGALIGVVSAGVGFFLRGKVSPPTVGA